MRLRFTILGLALFSFISAFAQTRPLRGVVTGADNKGVVGATVSVKGNSISTATDLNGRFTLTVPTGTITLEITSVGFALKSVDVTENENDISIQLTVSSQELGEVVVTALGISRQKRSLGYSVQDIKGDKVALARENNLANSLSGKIAGLQVSPTGNGPGGSSRMTIRGNNSLGGNNQPLIVIDGIPMDNEQTATGQSEYGAFDMGDGISQVNPEDIENISVLKGPAAAALYGNRGGNGVILITTKKGSKATGLGISLNSNVQIENPLLYPEMQNEYGQGANALFDKNSGGSWGPKITGQQVVDWTGNTVTLYADKNDLKNFLSTGRTLANSLELTGATDNSNFRLGYTNFDNQGLLPSSTIKRNQVTLRMGSTINKFLKADVKVSYTKQDGHNRPQVSGSPANIFALYTAGQPRSVHLKDMWPYKTEEGLQILWLPTAYSTLRNPYWVLYENFNNDHTDRLLSMISLDFKINSWLSLKLRHGMDYRNTLFQGLNDAYGIDGRGGGDPLPNFNSNYAENRTRAVETNADFLFTANKNFKDWSVTVNFGGNRLDGKFHNIGASTGVLDFPGAYNVAFGSLSRPFDQGPSKVRVNSLYALATVGYKNFAFIDGTFRNDWSSTLSEANRSFNYPSVNASLILNDLWEKAFNSSLPSFISYAKIRAGFAQAGNSIGPYALIPYSSIITNPQGIPTLSSPRIKPDPNILPEIVKSNEIGVELRFFRSRVGLDFTFYKKNATNQILVIPDPIAIAQGYIDGAYVNAGNVQNKGIEFVLTGKPLSNPQGLNWDITVNFNHNVNKVIRLHPDIPQYALQNTIMSRAIFITAEEGKPYGNMYGRSFAYDAQGRMIVEADGTPRKTPNKDVYLGNFQPKYLMGIINSLSFKGISLGFLIDIREGGQFYSQTNAYMYANGNAKGTIPFREGGWIVDGVHADGSKNTTAITSQEYWDKVAGAEPIAKAFMYDASNIRLREVTLGYSLPTKMLRKTPFRGIRFDLVGRNLWLIKSHVPGIDPESAFSTTNAQGWENGAYPSIRSFGFNLKIDL